MTTHTLAPQPGRLRVMSYNIHKGFSLDRRYTLNQIKKIIQEHAADLVFLQEVVGEHKLMKKKTSVDSQLEFLADTVWHHHAYGKNSVHDHGHHGNAILSGWPISQWENIDISTNRFEKRSILHAVVEREKREIHLLCVHLDLLEKGRRQQLERIIQRIKDHIPADAPFILAGDFNDWRKRATPVFAKELGVKEVFIDVHGHHAVSFPSFKPYLSLDRIYVRGFECVSAECFTHEPWDRLSDHGALFAELKLS